MFCLNHVPLYYVLPASLALWSETPVVSPQGTPRGNPGLIPGSAPGFLIIVYETKRGASASLL